METSDRIEPCVLENYPRELANLLAEIGLRAAERGSRLHPTTATRLADLVAIMNCYYSNLIEGLVRTDIT